MDEMTCAMCRDLMPLVRDGIACEDSVRAVERHIGRCADCARLYQGCEPAAGAQERVLRKALRGARLGSAMLLMLGLVFGLSLTQSGGLFYNILIMPVIGVLGYAAFGRKGTALLPVVLFVTYLATNLLAGLRGEEVLDGYSLVMWSLVYSAFALLGAGVAAMLHTGLGRKRPIKKAYRVLLCSAALVLSGGLIWFGSALTGNPVSRALASSAAERHLQQQYAGRGYEIESVRYDFKTNGGYYIWVRRPGSLDDRFSLWADMLGHIVSDEYEKFVTSGRNTAQRLDEEYDRRVRDILKSPSAGFEADIAYGGLEYAEGSDGEVPSPIEQKELVLDGVYDVAALGAQAGRLVVYVQSAEVNVQTAGEVVLRIRELMDAGGLPFYSLDFVLEYPRGQDGALLGGTQVRAEGILYEDITQGSTLQELFEVTEK